MKNFKFYNMNTALSYGYFAIFIHKKYMKSYACILFRIGWSCINEDMFILNILLKCGYSFKMH